MAKPLSPDAQSVLDAANGASSYGPDDCLNDAPRIAAAALRELADQVAYTDSEGGRFIYVPEVLAIAAELEGRGDG